MKKRMYKWSVLITFLFAGFITSCDNDDEYSLNNYWVGIATINAPDATGNFALGHKRFSLILDNTETLFPSYFNSAYSHVSARHEQRALINFTQLSDNKDGYDHLVRLNAINPILTKQWQILTADTTSTSHLRGKLPIEIKDAWVGNGYLNIVFDYLSGLKSIHYINLVEDREKTDLNPDQGVWTLHFVRNSNDIRTEYRNRGMVAFRLTEMPTGVKTIRLKAKTHSAGEQIVECKYSDTTTEKMPQSIESISNDINLQ